MNERFFRIAALLIAGVALLLLLSVFSPQPLPFERALLRLAPYDTAFLRDAVTRPPEFALRRALRIDVLMLFCAVIAGAVLLASREWILRPHVRNRLVSVMMTVACSAAIFVALARFGFDASFCPIRTLMTNPGSLSVYGQRLLLVWLADAIKLLAPSLTYRVCYLITQLVAILAATYMVGQWTSLFVGSKLKPLGQLLWVAMVVPTITYYTFYDIAIVFFYCCCLLLLYKHRYGSFLLVLGIGTLNYESTLLLVGVALFALYGVTPRRIWIGVPLAALVVWAAVRFSIQLLVPMESHFDPRVWNNILDLSRPSREIIQSAASLVFWWICAALSFRSADPFVRRATILFPALMGVTFIAGKFIEARQFDAFIPVSIGLIVSSFKPQRGQNDPRALTASH